MVLRNGMRRAYVPARKYHGGLCTCGVAPLAVRSPSLHSKVDNRDTSRLRFAVRRGLRGGSGGDGWARTPPKGQGFIFFLGDEPLPRRLQPSRRQLEANRRQL